MADIPSEKEIAKLPRWAIVAFAARCAGKVEPIVLHAILDQKDQAAISLAIQIAQEYAATGGRTTSNAAEAAKAANEATEAAFAAFNVDNATTDAVIRAAQAATNSLKAAATEATDAVVGYGTVVVSDAFAAFVADRTGGHMSASESMQSEAAKQIGEDISLDFEMLLRKAVSEKWTDDTPVPQTVFEQDLIDSALSIQHLDLWIDPGTAPREVIAEILCDLSMLYRKTGGSGIRFDPDRVKLLAKA